MKKQLYLLYAMLLIGAGVFAQPQITWRFANPEIIRQSTSDRLEFDLQVKASESGTYLFSGQYNLTFNNSAFVTSSLNTTVIRSGISDQYSDDLAAYKYAITRNNTGVVPNMVINVALTPSEVAILDEVPSNAWSAELTTEWQTFTRLRIKINDPSLLAGITFIEASMNGQINYHSAPGETTYYASPNLYESLNLNLLNLGRIYSEAYGWSQIGETQIDWNAAVNTTVFDGSAAITQNNDTEALANNLNILEGANLSIGANKWLTVNGSLASANNDALIISDGGSLLHGTALVNATVHRSLSGGSINATTHRYHLVAVPMDESSAYNAIDIFESLYLWDFDAEVTQDWSSISAGNTPINNKEGYLLWSDEATYTLGIAGKLNAGDYNLPTKNMGINSNNESYRLVVNPYPSALQWTTPAGYDAAVYFFNAATGNYETFADGVPNPAIAPVGQSFFIKKSSPGGVANAISISNGDRLHHNEAFYKSVSNIADLLHIKASSDISEDHTYIRFHEMATNHFDSERDAIKLNGFGDAPQLYTNFNGIDYAINTLETTNTNIVVPLFFEMTMDGLVNLEVTGLQSFTQIASVYLEDMYLSEMIDLSEQNTYSFVHEQGLPADRFRVHFYGVLGNETIQSQPIKIWNFEKYIYIKLPQQQNSSVSVELYDQLGKLIYSYRHTADDLIMINASNFPKFLVVKVHTASNIETSKLINQ